MFRFVRSNENETPIALSSRLCHFLYLTFTSIWSHVAHFDRFDLLDSRFQNSTPNKKIDSNESPCKISKMNLISLLSKLYDDYTQKTSNRLKIIDAYMFYILLTGIIQFVYCCLVGTFPFNSFLSGFISCVGSFVLAGKVTFCSFRHFL